MFKNQPKGLFALALANTGERFGYYTMLAVFALFLRANFGLSASAAGAIYSTFLAFVYFLPLIGGIVADKIGYGKCVTIGIIIMFLGYVLLAIPMGGVEYGSTAVAMTGMIGALVLISFGTGLFKGNLQVMVGNLYDDPQYADRRDAAFSLFYMAINIGAMFAPMRFAGIEYRDLLCLPPLVQACGEHCQAGSCKRTESRDADAGADQETYCGALSCVCGCAVLLDGVPPERSDADLFCQ